MAACTRRGGCMRCVFREHPPPLREARLVTVSALAEAVLESFYSGGVEALAVYPSVRDALEVLAERLGGFTPLTPLPGGLRVRSGRGAFIAANPTPLGEPLDCDTVCAHEPIVVYEGWRVAQPAPSVAECGCVAYSLASLADYGVDSSIAWVAGLEGGLSGSTRVPGVETLAGLAGLVTRLRARSLAAIMGVARPERVGPFAAFLRERLPVLAEAVDAARYGLRGFYAYSLFAESGCYTPWGES